MLIMHIEPITLLSLALTPLPELPITKKSKLSVSIVKSTTLRNEMNKYDNRMYGQWEVRFT